MKELKFRYTDHGSYSLARSFLIMIGMVLIASGVDLIFIALPIDWQALGATSNVIRSILMALGAIAGIYLGFKASLKLFDREGVAILDADKLILKLGRKEHEFYIKDIEEVGKDIFAKYDGLRFKDTKPFGPLFTKHSIMTDKGEFLVMASVEEGWIKAGKSVFDKENPVPIYSIDDAFKEINRYVNEVKKHDTPKIHEE